MHFQWWENTSRHIFQASSNIASICDLRARGVGPAPDPAAGRQPQLHLPRARALPRGCPLQPPLPRPQPQPAHGGEWEWENIWCTKNIWLLFRLTTPRWRSCPTCRYCGCSTTRCPPCTRRPSAASPTSRWAVIGGGRSRDHSPHLWLVQILELSHNRLESLQFGQFAGLINLRIVYMANNR